MAKSKTTEERIWKTIDGREIKFSELEDDHLLNIMRHTERKADMYLQRYCNTLRPERRHAYYQSFMSDPVAWLIQHPPYIYLMEEVNRRKLLYVSPNHPAAMSVVAADEVLEEKRRDYLEEPKRRVSFDH